MRDVWITASPEERAAGRAREAQEEQAARSAEQVEAPPCQACGAAVRDADFERHSAEVHNRPRQIYRPWGRPSSRELLIAAPTPQTVERKVAEWRTRNPGVRLLPLGEGQNEETGLLWIRCRIAPIFREHWLTKGA